MFFWVELLDEGWMIIREERKITVARLSAVAPANLSFFKLGSKASRMRSKSRRYVSRVDKCNCEVKPPRWSRDLERTRNPLI